MKTGELSNLQPERIEPVQFEEKKTCRRYDSWLYTGRSVHQVCLVISMAFHNTTLLILFICFTAALFEPRQTSKMELFAKVVSGWNSLTIFAKKVYLRYLTEFFLCLCSKNIPKTFPCGIVSNINHMQLRFGSQYR